MTKNLFLYYCLNIVSQISLYRQQLDQSIRNEPILLIVDGHPSRFSFLCCYIFYLFNIDLLPDILYEESGIIRRITL